ncbi:MAG: YtxH domain-containing protein [Anaerolineae bacterium]|nr:YtxH domain-containing protein [Anaerolineae bacterium]NUQ05327.1 YtxH domain-containing protein [Anaerolineae bacterium]
MRKLTSLGMGFLIGAVIGAALVFVFAPATGEKMRHALREGVRETMDEARSAARKREMELTEALHQRQKRPAAR